MIFPVAQVVKNLPAVWETWVQFLGWEDPLEREWIPTPVEYMIIVELHILYHIPFFLLIYKMHFPHY